MEERLISNQDVGGSIPSSSTNKQHEHNMEPENSFITAARTGRVWYESTPSSSNEWYTLYGDYEKHTNQPFKVGDLVCLKTGQAPQKVLEVKGHCIRCEYVSSRKQVGFRSASDFVPYEYYVPDEDENMKDYDMKDKLFKTLDGKRFGTGLAIDSDGKYVLKMQDNGNFEAFSESELKRVMPYTFDIEFLTGNTNRQNRYSYRGREGQVEVGNILLLNDSMSIARVVAVNTESESATKTFNGVKLVTEALE